MYQDSLRIASAERKISDHSRVARQTLRSEKKKKSEIKNTTYFSGAFELPVTPDIDLGDKKQTKKQTKKVAGNKKRADKRKITSTDEADNQDEADNRDEVSVKFVSDKEDNILWINPYKA